MPARNGPHGYGAVTKILHWLTVLAVVAQFAIGLSMDADAPEDARERRSEAVQERQEERAERRGEAAEELAEAGAKQRDEAADAVADEALSGVLKDVVTGRAFDNGVLGIEAHMLIGLILIVLALVRLAWRRTTPLPPWAEHLSDRERRLEGWLEKVLLTLLLVVPGSGLLLVLGGEDLLPVHVAAQIALATTIAIHVGLVLKHTVVHRNRHLARMT